MSCVQGSAANLGSSEGQGLHLKADSGGVGARHTEAVAQVNELQPHPASLCSSIAKSFQRRVRSKKCLEGPAAACIAAY